MLNLGGSLAGGGALQVGPGSLDANLSTLRLPARGSAYSGAWNSTNVLFNPVTPGSLGSGDITVSDASFDADYNASSFGATLTLLGGSSFTVQDQALSFNRFVIGVTDIGDTFKPGTYDDAFFVLSRSASAPIPTTRRAFRDPTTEASSSARRLSSATMALTTRMRPPPRPITTARSMATSPTARTVHKLSHVPYLIHFII